MNWLDSASRLLTKPSTDFNQQQFPTAIDSLLIYMPEYLQWTKYLRAVSNQRKNDAAVAFNTEM